MLQMPGSWSCSLEFGKGTRKGHSVDGHVPSVLSLVVQTEVGVGVVGYGVGVSQ